MRRWGAVLFVVCALAAVGCEGQYEVRGFVYAGEIEQGFVEVAKEEDPVPEGLIPLENATVALQVYKFTLPGESPKLADDFPPEEFYTDPEGKFCFVLPESLLDYPSRFVIGAKTRYQLTCQRMDYEEVTDDVHLPLDRKRHLRIYLKKLPEAGP